MHLSNSSPEEYADFLDIAERKCSGYVFDIIGGIVLFLEHSFVTFCNEVECANSVKEMIDDCRNMASLYPCRVGGCVWQSDHPPEVSHRWPHICSQLLAMSLLFALVSMVAVMKTAEAVGLAPGLYCGLENCYDGKYFSV